MREDLPEVPGSFDVEFDRLQGEALAALRALSSYLHRADPPLDRRQAHAAHLAVSIRAQDFKDAVHRNGIRNARLMQESDTGQTDTEAV